MSRFARTVTARSDQRLTLEETDQRRAQGAALPHGQGSLSDGRRRAARAEGTLKCSTVDSDSKQLNSNADPVHVHQLSISGCAERRHSGSRHRPR